MALVAEADLRGDLSGWPIGITQQHERALNPLASHGLVNPLSDRRPIGAGEPDGMDTQPKRDILY